jgi:hypothetical protein
MARKTKRLKPGRPPRDHSDDDPDLLVAELAVALMVVDDLSERMALDLALARLQGERWPATRLPRGSKGKEGMLVGYRLPQERTFASRSADIRRKFKQGKLRPRIRVIFHFIRLLHLYRPRG